MNIILKRISTRARARAAVMGGFPQVDAPLPDGVEEICDVPYTGHDNAKLAADIYRPVDAGGALPVAVVIHGGGLFVGTRKINRIFCGKLAAKGYLVFAIEYRLIDETNAFGEISDICAGFSFVAENLVKYGGNPKRVCVMGESAGAYLAVYATAMTGSKRLQELIGCAPSGLKARMLVCFSGMFYTAKHDPIGAVYHKDLYGTRCKDKNFRRYLNPEHEEVIGSLPPVLLTTSGADFLKSYTLKYAEALRKAGHSCELLFYKEGKELVHAFPSLRPDLPESVEVMERIDQRVAGIA